MKEISKYLWTSIQKKKIPKQKKPGSPTPRLKTFVQSIFHKIHQGEQAYRKASIQRSPIQGGGDFPKSYNYSYTPKSIRTHLENSHTQLATYQFSIRSQTILLHIVYPFSENQMNQNISAQKTQAFFESCLHKIYLWLFVASFYLEPDSCSQNLQIHLYLTDADKVLPDTQQPMQQDHVNTAFTTSCQPSTVINIYREEEWFKVLIHESFHCFGFDFSHDENLTRFSQQEIHALFPLNIEVLLYETYCEINAEILNVLFTVYWEKGSENQVYDSLYRESIFSCFQCIKVLQYHKIKWDQLFQPGTVYHENTNIFCYYVLKAMYMMNLSDYMNWFYEKNKGSFSFVRTQQNMKDFIDVLKNPSVPVTEDMHRMETWFSQQKKQDDLLFQTMRMTLVE